MYYTYTVVFQLLSSFAAHGSIHHVYSRRGLSLLVIRGWLFWDGLSTAVGDLLAKLAVISTCHRRRRRRCCLLTAINLILLLISSQQHWNGDRSDALCLVWLGNDWGRLDTWEDHLLLAVLLLVFLLQSILLLLMKIGWGRWRAAGWVNLGWTRGKWGCVFLAGTWFGFGWVLLRIILRQCETFT